MDFDFDGRLAAAIEDFAGNEVADGGFHRRINLTKRGRSLGAIASPHQQRPILTERFERFIESQPGHSVNEIRNGTLPGEWRPPLNLWQLHGLAIVPEIGQPGKTVLDRPNRLVLREATVR